MARKRVAAVVTEYRKWSHADVILRNLLEGYPDGGRPDLELVALYSDQIPKGDLSHDLAKKHGFTIFDSISACLCRGGKKLAVDAVLSIGEHGAYPSNEKGQILYPRRRFFEEITRVFEASDTTVPVFNDKHLAATWDDARWMYDRARTLFIPFLAGSSVSVTWRRPELVLPRGCELAGAVQFGYGPFEGYGFHALEGLQCMVERRRWGETGVAAVTCHSGEEMWTRMDAHEWTAPILDAAMKCIPAHARGDIRELTAKVKDSGIVEVEYRDGLRAFVIIANGWVQEGEGGGFAFAGKQKGKVQVDACQFYLQQPDPFAHFAELTRAIDALVRTGHAPYPVERTLLTTGILDAAMTSRQEKGKRIDTPHLKVEYTPTDWPPAKGQWQKK